MVDITRKLEAETKKENVDDIELRIWMLLNALN
jgi:hypothetical protein